MSEPPTGPTPTGPTPPGVRGRRAMLATRVSLGAIGIGIAGYGIYRILSEPRLTQPAELLRWLVVAVVLHDGLIVPLTALVGVALTAAVPARARRYLQGVAIAVAVLLPVALIEIYRRGSQPAAKALLTQNYAAHLLAVAGAIAAIGAMAYLLRRRRDHRGGRPRRVRQTNTRPSAVHDPP